jgi:4-amino-4-deoxy-L-arabinose transferase-like glycosyltransferase
LTDPRSGWRRWGIAAWVAVIAGFALLHAWHLRADFPNGSPWSFDWAKYTDEGWYGNAATRAHLFGNWYLAGDFNPAVAVPVWPFMEWLLYFFTGVSIEAARGLAIACFFLSLALSYLLVRAHGSQRHPTGEDLSAEAPAWMALLAVTLLVTSPFLYCFSRLAILEPLQTTLTLVALNLAVRLKRMRRPVVVAIAIGVLMTLVVLTKTTGVFLLPAMMWAIVVAMWERRRLAIECAAAMACTAVAGYTLWIGLIARMGLYGDFKYYFFVNDYPKPAGLEWPLVALMWTVHGLLWVDHSLVLLAGVITVGAAIAARSAWGKMLWRDPLFGCSLWVVAGYVLFMTMQNHPQPRYFAVPAFFCFFIVVLGVEALLRRQRGAKRAGWALAMLALTAAAVHGVETIGYAMHPEYTWVNAAENLTQYIDGHPNGKRLLVSISGDEITLITHLPSLCDDFGTWDLPAKTAAYQPGWYASWNDIDMGTIQDLHVHFSLEQVAEFKAFDSPDRNMLVLFKLRPLAAGAARDPDDPVLKDVMPDDKIDVPVE